VILTAGPDAQNTDLNTSYTRGNSTLRTRPQAGTVECFVTKAIGFTRKPAVF